MHTMRNVAQPQDFLIASGQTTSLRQLVETAFALAGLDSQEWLEQSGDLLRPSDLTYSAMDPNRIASVCGWKSTNTLQQIVEKMYHDILF